MGSYLAAYVRHEQTCLVAPQQLQTWHGLQAPAPQTACVRAGSLSQAQGWLGPSRPPPPTWYSITSRTPSWPRMTMTLA